MFKQAICLTHYSDSFIGRLEMLGYKRSTYFSGSSKTTRDDVCICTCVVVNEDQPVPVYCIVDKKTALSEDPRITWTTGGINRIVTDNESIAFGLAALTDDNTDKYQFFTIDCDFQFDNGRELYKKGHLFFCTRDRWNLDFDNDGNPLVYSSRNVPAHKSTKEEILEFFKKEIK
jgi:hypothetical protein